MADGFAHVQRLLSDFLNSIQTISHGMKPHYASVEAQWEDLSDEIERTLGVNFPPIHLLGQARDAWEHKVRTVLSKLQTGCTSILREGNACFDLSALSRADPRDQAAREIHLAASQRVGEQGQRLKKLGEQLWQLGHEVKLGAPWPSAGPSVEKFLKFMDEHLRILKKLDIPSAQREQALQRDREWLAKIPRWDEIRTLWERNGKTTESTPIEVVGLVRQRRAEFIGDGEPDKVDDLNLIDFVERVRESQNGRPKKKTLPDSNEIESLVSELDGLLKVEAELHQLRDHLPPPPDGMLIFDSVTGQRTEQSAADIEAFRDSQRRRAADLTKRRDVFRQRLRSHFEKLYMPASIEELDPLPMKVLIDGWNDHAPPPPQVWSEAKAFLQRFGFRLKAIEAGWKDVAAQSLATVDQVAFWFRKLENRDVGDAGGQFRFLDEYMASRHGLSRADLDKMTMLEIASILRADYEKVGKSESSPPPPPAGPIQIQDEKVFVNGEEISLGLTVEKFKDVTCFLRHIVDQRGNWISGPEIAEAENKLTGNDLEGVRWDRIFKSLPKVLKKHIQSVSGKGYRLKVPLA